MKDTLFQHILKPITAKLMTACVERYQSDYRYESFRTFEHLKTMIYAHLNEIKSLRILEIAINSQRIGLETQIKRSTLSDANAKRSSAPFFWILKQLMCLLPKKRYEEMDKFIRILDSSPLQAKGHGYDVWAKQYATRHIQGLKLHVEYDLTLEAPVRSEMSYPNCNDVCVGKHWAILKDCIYIFDKGYYDYNWWWDIHQKQAYFVTRLKKNAAIEIEAHKKTNSDVILKDDLFRISNKIPRGGKRMNYNETLRRIVVKRKNKKPLILVTNLKDLPAEQIASLYKARWEIELFFKWIKQNLKIKKFLGRSENSVKIQIATALITYLLILFFKMQTQDARSLRMVLTWVRYNLGAFPKGNTPSYKPPNLPPKIDITLIKLTGVPL